MRVQLVLQPYVDEVGLYDILAALLPTCTGFTAAVAWAKRSGLERIAEEIVSLRSRSGTARLILGIDEGGATRQGLRRALADFDEAYVLHERGRTFHPKLYVLQAPGVVHVFVGSNNLTAGGLVTNHEAGVLMELDPREEVDAEIIDRVQSYLERMLEDSEICIRLTSVNVDRLIDDARYQIADEDDSRSRSVHAAPDVDSTVDVGDGSLFGSSRHRKRRLPPVAPRRRRSDRTGRTAPALATIVGRTANVIRRWTKKLSRSDVMQITPGSNPTDNLKLTQARHPIQHRVYFRESFFAEEDWSLPDPRTGRESAKVLFEVVVEGDIWGEFELEISHQASRASGQGNVPTWLHWDTIKDRIRSGGYSGKFVALESFDDGTYRLTIDEQPGGEFIG